MQESPKNYKNATLDHIISIQKVKKFCFYYEFGISIWEII
jgi:hypothetical protein